MKNEKIYMVFLYIKYSKFWSILLEHFVERKPLISEECGVWGKGRTGHHGGDGRAGGSPPSLKDWILADRSCLNDRSLLARANICRSRRAAHWWRPPTKVLLYDDPYPRILSVTKWTFTSLFINLLLRIERPWPCTSLPLFVFVCHFLQ